MQFDKKKIVLFFLLFLPVLVFSLESKQLPRLNINVYGQLNARGLETDLRIMKEALEALNQSVTCLDFSLSGSVKADINIFFQLVPSEKLKDASLNWFIPNPEWCSIDSSTLDKIDLVLCRTHFVEDVFKDTKKTYFLGFTSPDARDLGVKKEFKTFLHLAGGSLQKGTGAILKVWKKNPKYPRLILVTHYPTEKVRITKNVRLIHEHLEERKLRYYQNYCGIHVCPSEAEGFGHTLMESMAAGAVLVTTDAPPMNEFITDPRCLVPYNRTESQWMGTNYYVNDQQLEKKIQALMDLPQSEKEAIGKQNRLRYEVMKEEFHQNLKRLLKETCSIKN